MHTYVIRPERWTVPLDSGASPLFGANRPPLGGAVRQTGRAFGTCQAP
jgi:hypothetical protein